MIWGLGCIAGGVYLDILGLAGFTNRIIYDRPFDYARSMGMDNVLLERRQRRWRFMRTYQVVPLF